MDRPRVTYTPCSEVTPEGQLNVLANVYRFILDCNAKKLGTEPAPESDGHDDHEMFRQEAKEAGMT